MAAATSIFASPPFLPSLCLKPNHRISSNSGKSYPSTSSPLNLIASRWPSPEKWSSQYPPSAAPLNGRRWRLSALRENLFLLDSTPVEENAQEVVSASQDGASYIISGLLVVAFAGLSVLTIGVIYIAVTDFLQKRETEKFQKEEEVKKKKSNSKGKIKTRARAGPRGFGQKIEEEIEDATD